MKIETSELTGPALDWAVAVCEGASAYLTDEIALGGEVMLQWTEKFDTPLHHYTPSTDWAQGGPIIERERIELINTPCDDPCKAIITPDASEPRLWFVQYGPTPLVAAMRCYVAVKLGDVVDVPEELTV